MVVFALLLAAFLAGGWPFGFAFARASASGAPGIKTYSGVIQKGQTVTDILQRHGIDTSEIASVAGALKGTGVLRKFIAGREYAVTVSGGRLESFRYFLNDDSLLTVKRAGKGFRAVKSEIPYEKRIGVLSGTIRDNLVSSMDDVSLALELSDIFAWDIDFTTDLRQGDSYKVVVEELLREGKFKKYGSILSAEFHNDGSVYYAYRFGKKGQEEYFDEQGKSLRKPFLKAPLSYRRISSGFTNSRYHPLLKTFRPHLGVDYSAPQGTPVSAVGDGRVEFAGYKNGFGKIIILKHPGGYSTYYGHLHGFAKNMRGGAKVKQGQVIGYVGATGLATGPHLDYRVLASGRFINPLKMKMPRGRPVPKSLMASFKRLKTEMNERLAGVGPAKTRQKG